MYTKDTGTKKLMASNTIMSLSWMKPTNWSTLRPQSNTSMIENISQNLLFHPLLFIQKTNIIVFIPSTPPISNPIPSLSHYPRRHNGNIIRLARPRIMQPSLSCFQTERRFIIKAQRFSVRRLRNHFSYLAFFILINNSRDDRRVQVIPEPIRSHHNNIVSLCLNRINF